MQYCSFGENPLNRTYIFAATLVAALCTMVPCARAYDHGGEHNSAQHISRARYEDHRADRDRDLRLRHEREERLRHEREERMRREREARLHREHHVERHEIRDHRSDHDRRQGWEHGQKRGWHGDNLPPGQAKKADGR